MNQVWIVAGDFHVPYENMVLFDKWCKLIYEVRPYGIILNGDFLDTESISSYNRKSLRKQKYKLLDEYQSGCVVLDKIDNVAGDAVKVFMYGNHEQRFDRFLDEGDNGVLEGTLMTPREGLRLKERYYHVVKDYPDGVYKLGAHLDVVHGEFINIHAAKKHREAYESSVIFGHTHRFQVDGTGSQISYNTGCMCEIFSEGMNYMSRAQRMRWLNGFSEVVIDDNGYFYVNSIPVYNNKFLAHGKLY